MSSTAKSNCANSKGSSWIPGWWLFSRDEVRGDWLRGNPPIDPGASHALIKARASERDGVLS
jgi:hypothetical protein